MRELIALGLVRRVLRGVYAVITAEDSVAFRCKALGLVLADEAIVTDRAAAWLHGMPILKRGSHLVAPDIEVCHLTDTRTTRSHLDGHRRQLLARDIEVVEGIRVTTALRTACDLGRLLWRFDAIAALDSALSLGVPHEELLLEIDRFRGFRGVRQLRLLAPLADGRAESPPESALRLRWYDACLPTPTPQLWVVDDDGVERYRVDLACEAAMFAAEYDGIEFHTGAAAEHHDTERRRWLADRGWFILIFGKDAVYAPRSGIERQLKFGIREARSRITPWTP